MLRALIYLNLLCTTTVLAQDGARMWRDKTGNFSVRAMLIEANSSSVQLRKEDGPRDHSSNQRA